MDKLYSQLNDLGNFAIYGAGEFATLLIKYCANNDLYDNIISCLVSKCDQYTPGHILGIKVAEFNNCKINQSTAIVIAILSKSTCEQIKEELNNYGYRKVLIITEKEFREINKSLMDNAIAIRYEMRRYMSSLDDALNDKFNKLAMLINSTSMVAEIHKHTFGKYKDIYKGKSVVLCGAGKSLKKYSFDDEYIHMGCNSVAFYKEAKLDYYFIQHIPADKGLYQKNNLNVIDPEIREKYLHGLNEMKCTKFVGQAIGEEWHMAPPIGDYYSNGVRPYFISNDIMGLCYFSKDIRYSLLYGAYSVIFPMIQFALFTNPDKIYLVGCDGYEDRDNYFDDDFSHEQDNLIENNINVLSKNYYGRLNYLMKKRYEELSDFAHMCYPRTKIIMVNPQKYKGIFEETITDENGLIIS